MSYYFFTSRKHNIFYKICNFTKTYTGKQFPHAAKKSLPRKSERLCSIHGKKTYNKKVFRFFFSFIKASFSVKRNFHAFPATSTLTGNNAKRKSVFCCVMRCRFIPGASWGHLAKNASSTVSAVCSTVRGADNPYPGSMRSTYSLRIVTGFDTFSGFILPSLSSVTASTVLS